MMTTYTLQFLNKKLGLHVYVTLNKKGMFHCFQYCFLLPEHFWTGMPAPLGCVQMSKPKTASTLSAKWNRMKHLIRKHTAPRECIPLDISFICTLTIQEMFTI